MTAKGLDDDGFIRREGSLARVPKAFTPVVDAARTRIAQTFGSSRLQSACLYGSIARGTAVPGRGWPPIHRHPRAQDTTRAPGRPDPDRARGPPGGAGTSAAPAPPSATAPATPKSPPSRSPSPRAGQPTPPSPCSAATTRSKTEPGER
jgi:hypothetical protein